MVEPSAKRSGLWLIELDLVLVSQVVEIGGSSLGADGGACKTTLAMRVRGFGRGLLCGDGSRDDLRSKEAMRS
jgi:hypothetical protein